MASSLEFDVCLLERRTHCALLDPTASVPTPAIPWQHATSTVGQTSKAHLVCHQCQQKFNGKKNMRRHGTESGHQWQPSVRCSACFKAFNTRLEFKAHVPQVSCLDAPMIRLLRSKPAVGAIPASTELQACQSMGDPPRSEGTAIVDANVSSAGWVSPHKLNRLPS